MLPERVHIIQSPWQYYYYIAPETNAIEDINAFIDWLHEEFSQDEQRLSKLANENKWYMPAPDNPILNSV